MGSPIMEGPVDGIEFSLIFSQSELSIQKPQKNRKKLQKANKSRPLKKFLIYEKWADT